VVLEKLGIFGGLWEAVFAYQSLNWAYFCIFEQVNKEDLPEIFFK